MHTLVRRNKHGTTIYRLSNLQNEMLEQDLEYDMHDPLRTHFPPRMIVRTPVLDVRVEAPNQECSSRNVKQGQASSETGTIKIQK